MDAIEYQRPMETTWIPLEDMPRITAALCSGLEQIGAWLDPSRISEGYMGYVRPWGGD